MRSVVELSQMCVDDVVVGEEGDHKLASCNKCKGNLCGS